MKRILNNEKGQTGMLSFFVGAMIAVIIALQVAWPVMDTAIYAGGGYATNTYNFTGNSTTGEYINITTSTIANSVLGGNTMCMYFNTSGAGKPTGCLVVNVASGANTSSGSATAFRAAIANETDIGSYITVTNTSTTNAVITLNRVGDIYNWDATDTVTNGGWAAAAFSGGAFGGTANMNSATSTIVDQLPLFLVLVLLMVFVKAVI